MKVSIFSAFYPFRGGIAQFNARLFRELEKKHEVTAFTFKKQYPDFLFPGKTQLTENDDSVDKIPAARIVSTFNPFTYCKAARLIKKSNPDLFITNYWMSFFGIFMGILASKQDRKTKKIAIIHNLVPHEKRFFDKWMNSFFVKRYDGFVVMSNAVKNDLLQMNPNAKHLLINHPWYDHFGKPMNKKEARIELKIDENKKTILFFGIIRDYKGLDLLLDAFSRLNDNYQLLIAGEIYGNKEKYKNQIRNISGRDRIFFEDRYIPDSQVSTFFSAADVCVLPYRTATQSGITATSFHFEVPMIVTNVGGLKEIVTNEKTGLVVDEPDSDLLKNAINQYFENDLHQKFKKNIQLEKEHNSWSNFVNSIITFSDSL